MARGKKKEFLTQEERLQAALVPESEQPYSVPENWSWVKVGDLCTFIGGGTPDKTNPLYWNGNISWASVKDIKGSYLYSTIDKISQLGLESSSSNLCEAGDLLLVTRIEPAKAIVSKIVTAINQDLKIVKSELSSLFLYHYFCAFQHEFEKKASGSTVKGITLPNIQNTPFPLPPLPEQHRIVDRIESLFAKLDEARQKAQDALDSFETRKAAILHRAFTGELTAQWRKEHGVGMESWKEETLESVCYSIFDGDHMPPPKSEQGIPFLVISNVNTGHLSFENTRFVPESYYEALSDTRKPEYGDVLYTLVGSYGIPVIVDREHPFCFQRHMALLKPKNIDSYYLWYILQSREMFEKATQIATGTAQLTVPIKGLRQLKFNCASANEQGEIVRILDDLLAKEQQAKETAEGVLEQIDLIKKAILARAFRGELGTNDPSEESAVELLKQVL